jgi:hypothetical protein
VNMTGSHLTAAHKGIAERLLEKKVALLLTLPGDYSRATMPLRCAHASSFDFQ